MDLLARAALTATASSGGGAHGQPDDDDDDVDVPAVFVPDTVMVLEANECLWMYTAASGRIKVKAQNEISAAQVVRTLGSIEFPDDVCVVLKRPALNPLPVKTNQGDVDIAVVEGAADVTPLSTNGLVELLRDPPKGNYVIQRYCKSKGDRAAFMRVHVKNSKIETVHRFASAWTYSARAAAVLRFTASPTRCDPKRVRGANEMEAAAVALEVAETLQVARGKPCTRLYVDLVRGDDNRLWVINVRGAKFKGEAPTPGRPPSARGRGESAGAVNLKAPDTSGMKRQQKKQSSSTPSPSWKRCASCQMVHARSADDAVTPNRHRLTMRQVREMEHSLARRGIFLPWFGRPAFQRRADEDAALNGLLSADYEVCDACYRLSKEVAARDSAAALLAAPTAMQPCVPPTEDVVDTSPWQCDDDGACLRFVARLVVQAIEIRGLERSVVEGVGMNARSACVLTLDIPPLGPSRVGSQSGPQPNALETGVVALQGVKVLDLAAETPGDIAEFCLTCAGVNLALGVAGATTQMNEGVPKSLLEGGLRLDRLLLLGDPLDDYCAPLAARRIFHVPISSTSSLHAIATVAMGVESLGYRRLRPEHLRASFLPAPADVRVLHPSVVAEPLPKAWTVRPVAESIEFAEVQPRLVEHAPQAHPRLAAPQHVFVAVSDIVWPADDIETLSPERRALIRSGELRVSMAIVQAIPSVQPVDYDSSHDDRVTISGAGASTPTDPWEAVVPLVIETGTANGTTPSSGDAMLHVFVHSAGVHPDSRELIASGCCATSFDLDDEPRRQRILLTTPEGAQGTALVYIEFAPWGAPHARHVRRRMHFDGSGSLQEQAQLIDAEHEEARVACDLAFAASRDYVKAIDPQLPILTSSVRAARECAFSQRSSALALHVAWIGGNSELHKLRELTFIVHVAGLTARSVAYSLRAADGVISPDLPVEAYFRVGGAHDRGSHLTVHFHSHDATEHARLCHALVDSPAILEVMSRGKPLGVVHVPVPLLSGHFHAASFVKCALDGDTGVLDVASATSAVESDDIRGENASTYLGMWAVRYDTSSINEDTNGQPDSRADDDLAYFSLRVGCTQVCLVPITNPFDVPVALSLSLEVLNPLAGHISLSLTLGSAEPFALGPGASTLVPIEALALGEFPLSVTEGETGKAATTTVVTLVGMASDASDAEGGAVPTPRRIVLGTASMRVSPAIIQRVLRVNVSVEEDEDDLGPPKMARAMAFAVSNVKCAANAVIAVTTSGKRGAIAYRRADGSELHAGDREREVDGTTGLMLYAWSAGARILISQPDPDGSVGIRLKLLERGETRTLVHFYADPEKRFHAFTWLVVVAAAVGDDVVDENEQYSEDDFEHEGGPMQGALQETDAEPPSAEEELAALDAKASAGMLLLDEELERMRDLRGAVNAEPPSAEEELAALEAKASAGMLLTDDELERMGDLRGAVNAEPPSAEEELAALDAKASAGMLLTDEELERMRDLRGAVNAEPPSAEEELAALEAKASAGMLLTDDELERMRDLRSAGDDEYGEESFDDEDDENAADAEPPSALKELAALEARVKAGMLLTDEELDHMRTLQAAELAALEAKANTGEPLTDEELMRMRDLRSAHADADSEDFDDDEDDGGAGDFAF